MRSCAIARPLFGVERWAPRKHAEKSKYAGLEKEAEDTESYGCW